MIPNYNLQYLGEERLNKAKQVINTSYKKKLDLDKLQQQIGPSGVDELRAQSVKNDDTKADAFANDIFEKLSIIYEIILESNKLLTISTSGLLTTEKIKDYVKSINPVKTRLKEIKTLLLKNVKFSNYYDKYLVEKINTELSKISEAIQDVDNIITKPNIQPKLNFSVLNLVIKLHQEIAEYVIMIYDFINANKRGEIELKEPIRGAGFYNTNITLDNYKYV